MKQHPVRAAALASLLALIMLVALSACSVSSLYSSGDPTVGLITAQKDLAAGITAGAADSFTLSVVEDYGQELVVLASDKAYTGTHVWLMDANLKILQTLSNADIGGAAFSGSRAWFDAWSVTPHRVIIGNQMFALNGSTLSFLAWTVPQGPGTFFFADHSGGNYDMAGIYATGNTLVFSRYYDTWGDVSTNPMGVTIGPASSYALMALFSDANAVDTAGQAAFLVLRDVDAATDHFLKIPWSDFMGTLAQPLLATYELFSRPAVDRSDLLGYSGGAFLALARDSGGGGGDFLRFDQTGKALPGTLHFERIPDMSTAYSLSGTHYFTFDRATRVVSRRASWWK